MDSDSGQALSQCREAYGAAGVLEEMRPHISLLELAIEAAESDTSLVHIRSVFLSTSVAPMVHLTCCSYRMAYFLSYIMQSHTARQPIAVTYLQESNGYALAGARAEGI